VFAAVLVAGAKRQAAVAWRSISTIFDTAGGATSTSLKTFGTSAGSVTNWRTSAAVAVAG
jgi:amino acid transporter